MEMLIGVPHVATEENERVIQQGAVAIVNLLKIVDQMGDHLHVVLIELGEIRDARRIFTVV